MATCATFAPGDPRATGVGTTANVGKDGAVSSEGSHTDSSADTDASWDQGNDSDPGGKRKQRRSSKKHHVDSESDEEELIPKTKVSRAQRKINRDTAAVIAAIKTTQLSSLDGAQHMKCHEIIKKCNQSFRPLIKEIEEGYASYALFRSDLNMIFKDMLVAAEKHPGLHDAVTELQEKALNIAIAYDDVSAMPLDAAIDASDDEQNIQVPQWRVLLGIVPKRDDPRWLPYSKAKWRCQDAETQKNKREQQQYSSSPADVRKDPRFTETLSFIRTFGPHLELPFISLADWEAVFCDGTTTDTCNVVHDILLRGLNIKANPTKDWPRRLWRFAIRAKEERLADVLEPLERYHHLLADTRLAVTHMLCFAQFDFNKTFQQVLKKDNACGPLRGLRSQCIGTDSEGWVYTLFDDNPNKQAAALAGEVSEPTPIGRKQPYRGKYAPQPPALRLFKCRGNEDGGEWQCCATTFGELVALIGIFKFRTSVSIESVPSPANDARNKSGTICNSCRRSDRPTELLLCDGCDSALHMDCAAVSVYDVPEQEWFCDICSERRLAIALCSAVGVHKFDRRSVSQLCVVLGPSPGLVVCVCTNSQLFLSNVCPHAAYIAN